MNTTSPSGRWLVCNPFFFFLLLSFVSLIRAELSEEARARYPIAPFQGVPYDNLFADKKGHGEMDITLSCGSNYKTPLLSLLRSIYLATDPHKVRVWAFAEEDDADRMNDLFEEYAYDKLYPRETLRVMRYERKVELDLALGIEDHEKARTDGKRTHILAMNQGNWIRFYMSEIFKKELGDDAPKQFLYLDCDMLVLEDPRNLANEISRKMGGDTSICMGAAERPSSKSTHWGAGAKALKTMGVQIHEFHGLNAGVLYFDCECWMQSGAVERILYWLRKNRAKSVFNQGKVGSQVPLYFTFYPSHIPLLPREGAEEFPKPWPYLVFATKWNSKAKSMGSINNSSIVHFTGVQKPWMHSGLAVHKHLYSYFNVVGEAAVAGGGNDAKPGEKGEKEI